MFFFIKKKWIILFLCLVVVFTSCIYFLTCKEVYIPVLKKCIVIDAGHGGIDGGCVGKRYGTVERDLNLKYSKCLEGLCKEFGFKVILTRENDEGLYSPMAKNKKKSEMSKREEIINKSCCDIVLSIHMNSSLSTSIMGGQVFFKKGNFESELLANSITASLKEDEKIMRGESKEGDYYILNCTDKSSVLIECGFLSNVEDEYNLIQNKYMEEFCNDIFCGVVKYLEN